MKSRSSERGITSWFPLTWVRLELLLLAAAHQLRQRYSDHEGAAVEHLLDERAEAEEDEACDPSHQEIDGDGRAPWVEAARHNAGRTQKGGSEGRQLISHSRHRV